MSIDAYAVRKALLKKFSDTRRYAVAEEVGLTTGFSHRRLDMIVLDCYASNGFRIDGIEIKVSTSDLRRELEDPEKHIAFFDVIDYYTLACPKSVVDPVIDLIPPKWGILIINEDGTTRYKRKPLALEDRVEKTVPRGFMAGLTRSILAMQPAEIELREKYEEGIKEGRERAERDRDYLSRRIEKEGEKLKHYDALVGRFKLWGDSPGEIEEAMKAFETFRSKDPDWINTHINKTIGDLKKLQEIL